MNKTIDAHLLSTLVLAPTPFLLIGWSGEDEQAGMQSGRIWPGRSGTAMLV
jgi:hypothetical protein